MKTTINFIAKALKIGIWISFLFMMRNYFDMLSSFGDSDTSLDAYTAAISLYTFAIVIRFFITYAITQIIRLLSEVLICICEKHEKAKEQ